MKKNFFDPEKIRQQSPWRGNIFFLERVTSTNDLLLELAEEGAPEGTMIIAKEQTRGRGQFHRPWSSPSGMGLWMSLLLRCPIENNNIAPLSQLGPISLFDTCLAIGIPHVRLQIKPPNDLFLDGKKLAGVLVETRRGKHSFALLGLGLNLSQCQDDFPPQLHQQAISLALAGFGDVSWDYLLGELLDALHENYLQFAKPNKLHERWKEIAKLPENRLMEVFK